MMLIGILMFRAGYLTLEVPTRKYVWMLILGYGIGIPLNYWEALTIYQADFSAMAQISGTFTYDIGRLSLALGHLALILLFCKAPFGAFIKSTLAATGRMALTNYLMQSIICGFIFYGFGFGLYGTLFGYEIFYVVAGIWALQLIWSPIWLKYYRFGPFEWLWRSLTYMQQQPMRR